MNECKFSQFNIGDTVTLHYTGVGSCPYCDYNLIGLSITGEYAGHITDENVYDLMINCNLVCPGCNHKLTKNRELCNAGGIWVIESFKVESEIEY